MEVGRAETQDPTFHRFHGVETHEILRLCTDGCFAQSLASLHVTPRRSEVKRSVEMLRRLFVRQSIGKR